MAYADRSGLEPDVAEAFIRVVQAMDAAYLDWLKEEEERRRRDGAQEARRKR